MILILFIHLGSLSHSLLSFIFSLSSQVCLQLRLKESIFFFKMSDQHLLGRVFSWLDILLCSIWGDSFENWHSFDNIFVNQIEFIQVRVLWASKSLLKALDIVVQHLFVAQELLEINYWAITWVFIFCLFLLLHFIQLGRVDELASVSIRTVGALMELLAKLGFVSRRDVLLLLEFVITMSESARVAVRTISYCCESSE